MLRNLTYSLYLRLILMLWLCMKSLHRKESSPRSSPEDQNCMTIVAKMEIPIGDILLTCRMRALIRRKTPLSSRAKWPVSQSSSANSLKIQRNFLRTRPIFPDGNRLLYVEKPKGPVLPPAHVASRLHGGAMLHGGAIMGRRKGVALSSLLLWVAL